MHFLVYFYLFNFFFIFHFFLFIFPVKCLRFGEVFLYLNGAENDGENFSNFSGSGRYIL